jgi:iron complex transport system substrate-binding protein
MLRALGERLDAADAAERHARAIEERVAAIQRWTEGRPRVTLVMVFDASPLFVAGPGSFPDELIRLAGGKNLIARGGKWPTVDMEHLMHLDPDVIVDAMGVGHGRTSVGSGPGWSELRAVKEGRVRRLGSATPLRPGPRIADGLAEVATAIHGQAPP